MKAAVFLILVAVPCCYGYQVLQDRIPNGGSVPHPCRPNHIWQGVGHLNPLGGGVRNPFGKDFHQNGQVWDSCICNYDSDGDGKTNGEELGDPDCVWSPGEAAEVTLGLTHPGICEPVNSIECLIKNEDLGDFCDMVNTTKPHEEVDDHDSVPHGHGDESDPLCKAPEPEPSSATTNLPTLIGTAILLIASVQYYSRL